MSTVEDLQALNQRLEARVAELTAALRVETAERRSTRAHAEHLSRMLGAIRSVNQLIVREKQPEPLIRRSCELLVETRDYRSAWIALAPGGQPGLVAGAGWGEAFGAFVEQVGRGMSPPCWERARNSPGLVQLHPERDCGGCPLRPADAGCGVLVAPLVHDQRLVGFLGVATSAEVAGDEAENGVTIELADDLALALSAIREASQHREEAERFRVSFESATIGRAVAATDGRFLRVNASLAGLLGYRVDELEGRSSADLTHPDDIASNLEAMRALEAGAPRQRFEKRYLRKDGGVVWVDASVAAVRDATGQVQYFIAGFVDVTERKRAEEALRASEDRFRGVFHGAIDGILVADSESGAFLMANPAICKMLGYSEEELLRLGIEDIHPAEEQRTVAEAVRRQLAGEEPLATDLPLRRGDGSVFRADVNGVPIRLGGRDCLLGVFRDVTTVQELENQLRQSQKMEAVGRLAGGVAHDFNNLLGIIIGYGELALRGLEPSDVRAQRLDQILLAAGKAADLTQKLLAFSRKQPLQPKVVSLDEAIADLEPMLRRVIGEDIQLVTIHGEGVGPVLADPGQLDQSVLNLVVNARDAMPRGGRLTLQTTSVDLDADDVRSTPGAGVGPHSCLRLTDSGVGMDPVTLSRALEPFFTTKGPGKGTGLGLAMVYGFVTQSRGHVSISSQIGRGTTVSVYLPRVPQEKRAELTADASPPPSGSETILVVEDEAALRELLCETLTEAGYRVLDGTTPEAALDLARSHPSAIHLLLTDVVMPSVSGPELATQVRTLRPQLSVLYMSGYALDAESRPAIADAGADVIEKPFTSAGLLWRIREVLDAPPLG
jgi:PAS domain S-box-containing protein